MISKNLKYYRLKKNLSKKELASVCGITPMAITNYESNQRTPDIEIINRLCDALDIRVVDLIASRNKSLVFNHCEFRKHSVLSKSRQDLVRESVEEYFGRFFDAVDCLGGNPLPAAPECHCIIRSENIEEDAKMLRRTLGLNESGPIYDLIGMLENRGFLIVELDVSDEHFSGMNGTVNGYPYIAINSAMRPERKRTTILHELAHLMFIWNETSEKENEKDATAIAGATLIAKEDIVRELGLKKTALTKDLALVCNEYGISMYLLVKRASIVGVISDSLEKDFYIKANKLGYKISEPSRVQNGEEPKLFQQLVYRAVNEEGINMQRGAELLRIPVSQMQSFCGLEV